MANHEPSEADYNLLTSDFSEKNWLVHYYSELVRGLNCPSRLLPDLAKVIPIEIHREIIELEKRSASEAATKLCDEVLKSKHQQAIDLFKEALKKHKYMNLYKRLNSEEVKDQEKEKEILKNNFTKLLDVDPNELMPHLFQMDEITKYDMEDIQAIQKNKGDSQAMQHLLLNLYGRSEHWLPTIFVAMKKTRYLKILEDIHPELQERESLASMVSVLNRMPLDSTSVDNTRSAVEPSLNSRPVAQATRITRPSDSNEQTETDPKRIRSGSATSPKQVDSGNMTTLHNHSETSPKSPVTQEVNVETDRKQLDSETDVKGYKVSETSSATQLLADNRMETMRQASASSTRADISDNIFPETELIDLRTEFFGSNELPSSQQENPSPPPSSENSYTFTPTACDSHDTPSAKTPPKDKHRSLSGVVPEELNLHIFQRELTADALTGENCLIVGPTGCGKTIVGLAIAKHIFEEASMAEDPKIAFLVPTIALVEQQLDQFRRYVAKSCIGLSGEEEIKVALSNLIEIHDVLVMTPQILLNALEKEDIKSLSVFSLMIFDECHRMTKGHPYNKIMSNYYVDVMLSPDWADRPVKLPQVVGLTASVGVGQASTLKMAVDHILELCANMAVKKISTVRTKQGREKLAQFVSDPNDVTQDVRGRTVDKFGDKVQEAMKQIENRIRQRSDLPQLSLEIHNIHKLIEPPATRGSDPYVQFVSKLKRETAVIHEQNIRRFFVSCSRHLEVYNNALLINADCRTKDALSFIEKEFQLFEDNRGSLPMDETDRWLDGLFSGMHRDLKQLSVSPECENPKLKMLEELISGFYEDNKNSLGILFCKTREMTSALMNWIKENQRLAWLNPHNLTGSSRGMTQSKMEDVLKFFKNGLHKIIIATSVVEEGLDVSACNYVIRYEHVTNDIARVQARGRARAKSAEYVLVAEIGRGNRERDEVNRVRERLMNQAIAEIDSLNPNEMTKRIRELQEKAKLERSMTEYHRTIAEERKKHTVHDGDFELRCIKCDALAAWSSDLRKIEQAHHVTLADDFESRVILKPHPNPKKYDSWEKRAKIHCKCGDDWGIKALYRNVPYHVLKATSFIFVGPHGERNIYKKWKNIPFIVEELSLQDMKVMSEKATSQLAAGDK